MKLFDVRVHIMDYLETKIFVTSKKCLSERIIGIVPTIHATCMQLFTYLIYYNTITILCYALPRQDTPS